MSKTRAEDGRPVFDPKTFSFTKRLKEIDLFFQGRSPVHAATRRIAANLRRAEIPYAVYGGMAVNAHGHRQTTDDVDVLLTPAGLEEFQTRLVSEYVPTRTGRKRRFNDRVNGVPVDIVLTGRCPRMGQSGPILYPDPLTAGAPIDGICYVNFVWLVQLKLAMHRYRDLGDVAALIRVHNLDESFLKNLNPSVHQDFIECLEEKRREDEYEARE